MRPVSKPTSVLTTVSSSTSSSAALLKRASHSSPGSRDSIHADVRSLGRPSHVDIAHEERINFFDTADHLRQRARRDGNHHRQLVRQRRRRAGADTHRHQGPWRWAAVPTRASWKRSGGRSRCRCRRARSSTPVVATSPAGKSYGPDQDCELLATLLATVGVGISVGSSAGLQHHGRVAGDAHEDARPEHDQSASHLGSRSRHLRILHWARRSPCSPSDR